MKRCPACKRVENDDTLAFCRADGTPLTSGLGSVNAEIGTVKFGSAPVASEVETSLLPHHTTDADIHRATGWMRPLRKYSWHECESQNRSSMGSPSQWPALRWAITTRRTAAI